MNKIKKPHGFYNEKMKIIPRDLLNQSLMNTLLSDLYITDVGYFPNALYHYRERLEGSDQYILIINVKGTGYIQINDNEYRIEENILLLIPKGVSHIYGSYENEPWDIYWVHFNGNKVKHYFDSIDLQEILIKHLNAAQITKILSLFSSIFETLENGMTTHNITHASIILSHLISQLFIFKDFYNEKFDKKTDHFIQVMEYLNQHIHDNITLDEMAEHINLSKSQLSLIFKEKTGSSPIDFLIRLKVQEACRLLNLTDLQVNEIANDVGYDDPYYFSRIFKKIMGISPTQYRDKRSI